MLFDPERETKGTWRFTERLAHEDDPPVIGTLYVRKEALKAMGWSDGPLEVTVAPAKKVV